MVILINTHALINRHSPIWQYYENLKPFIYKCPLQKKMLHFAVIFRTCCLITSHRSLFFIQSRVSNQKVNTGNHTVTVLIFTVFCSTMMRNQIYTDFEQRFYRYIFVDPITRRSDSQKNKASVLSYHMLIRDFFYLCILHLLPIFFFSGMQIFISVSPMMQWYCRLVIKNSVLDS